MNRKFSMGLMGVAAAVAAGLTALGQPTHIPRSDSVAPWDVEDGPSLDPMPPSTAPRPSDPKGLVKSDGRSVRLPSGTRIEIVRIGRRSEPFVDTPTPGAIPIWQADGAMYVPERVAWNEPQLAGGGDSRGERILTFRMEPPPNAEVSFEGYIPESARVAPHPENHSWIAPQTAQVYQMGAHEFVSRVVVDDRTASHIRLGVSTAPWHEVARVRIEPKSKDAQVLASGPWGTLRRVPPPPENSLFASAKSVMLVPTFVVDPPSVPAPSAYRIKNFSLDGRQFASFAPRVAEIIVEARPYEWCEFSDVHFNPHPKKWGPAYWGAEGEKAVSSAGNTRLEALIRPKSVEYGWVPAAVFAPDGKAWRGHPAGDVIQPLFGGGTIGENALVAAFRLDAGRMGESDFARIQGFTSTSEIPGKGLGAALSPWPQIEARRATSQLLFDRPANVAYVQFAVRYGSPDWRVVGSFGVPKIDFPSVPKDQLAMYRRHAAIWSVFSLERRPSGWIDIAFTNREPRSDLKQRVLTWQPADAEARIYAVLKKGQRVLMQPTSGSGDGSSGYDFELTIDEGPVYDASHHDARSKVRVVLRDVERFEVECREFSEPVYVVAKLPPLPPKG